MRKLYFLSLILGCHLFVSAQQANYLEGPYTLPVRIDTSLAGNLWEIGEPESFDPVFDTAFSAPNVIKTGLDTTFGPNSLSRFTATLYTKGALWGFPQVMFMFWHVMQANSVHAGGWIDVSYDGGGSWFNIYSDDNPYPLFVLDFSPQDSLFNGEVGFVGNYDQWQLSTLCWAPSAGILLPTPDSILVRFNFATDSLVFPGEGWMIDNLEAYPEFIHTVEELRNLGQGETLLIFPNPMQEELHVFYRIEERSGILLQFLNPQGQVLLQKDLGIQPRGLYMESLSPEECQLLDRLFFVRLKADNRQFYKKGVRGKG